MPLLWLLAALCLSNAIHANWGFYTPAALAWVALGCVFCLFSTLAGPKVWRGRRFENALYMGLFVAFFWQVYQLSGPSSLAIFGKPVPDAKQQELYNVLCLGAVLGFLGFWPLRVPAGFHTVRFLAMLTVHLVVGVLLIRLTPAPAIDVWYVQQDGSHALLKGINPYGITIPDIYKGGYGDLQHDGRIWFGYCYLPGSLLMVFPSVVLLNDPRYAHLTAMLVTAALMAFARPSRISFAVASVFLFTPRLFYVLEQSWTEPFVLLSLSLMVFFACRAPRHVPKAIALLLTTKQSVIFILPMLWIWRPRLSLRQLAVATALSSAVILPFVLWSPQAFWHSAISLGRWFTLRQNSLSFAVWLDSQGIRVPSWMGFFLVGITTIWLYLRWNKKEFTENEAATPSLFMAGSALVWLAFFCCSIQSYCNYYFLIIGALCLAVAAWPQPDSAIDDAALPGPPAQSA